MLGNTLVAKKLVDNRIDKVPHGLKQGFQVNETLLGYWTRRMGHIQHVDHQAADAQRGLLRPEYLT